MEDSEETVKTAISKVQVPSDAVNGTIVNEPKIEKNGNQVNGTNSSDIQKDSILKRKNGKSRYQKYPKKHRLNGKKEIEWHPAKCRKKR